MPSTSSQLSTDKLRQALQLSERIERLQQQLNSVLGGSGSTTTAGGARAKGKAGKKGGRKLSAEARARIAAAARARWAKQRKGQGQRRTKGRGQAVAGTGTTPSKAIALPKKKGGLTPEGRARLAAAMRARWTQSRKSGSTPNAPKT